LSGELVLAFGIVHIVLFTPYRLVIYRYLPSR
jgi:hypothetical protein